MATIPYSRTVNVTVSRNNRFPSRRGFGIPLLLTSTALAGKVDSDNRTKLYASIDEVSADWATTTEFYRKALAYFARNPRPISLKAGFYDQSTASSAAGLQAELDVIRGVDDLWYQLVPDAPLRDTAPLDGLVEWVEARSKFAFIDSNDAMLLDASDASNIAARHKGTVERTAVFYHPDEAEELATSVAGYTATRDFDDANSAYTSKYKNAPTITPANVNSAQLTAITGFTPGLGQSETAGHCANAYIDIGDQDFLVEGSTLRQNVFIDEIHASDWIIARTEEETLGILLNNARIPFTDEGMQQLASAARIVMNQAVRAGLIAQDINPVTGIYEPAVEIIVPSVFDVPESQRVNRIAPAIQVRFRYAGAVHYVTVNYEIRF